AAATHRDFSIAADPIDQARSPRVYRACSRVAALVDVKSCVFRVEQAEADAVEIRNGAHHSIVTAPCLWIVVLRLLAVRLVWHLGPFRFPRSLVLGSLPAPQHPMRTPNKSC